MRPLWNFWVLWPLSVRSRRSSCRLLAFSLIHFPHKALVSRVVPGIPVLVYYTAIAVLQLLRALLSLCAYMCAYISVCEYVCCSINFHVILYWFIHYRCINDRFIFIFWQANWLDLIIIIVILLYLCLLKLLMFLLFVIMQHITVQFQKFAFLIQTQLTSVHQKLLTCCATSCHCVLCTLAFNAWQYSHKSDDEFSGV